MQAIQNNNEKNGRFYLEENGQFLAEISYLFSGTDKLIIDHTEIKSGNEDKALGQVLLEAAVNWAREKGFKILPLCPHARGLFDKTAAYADVRWT